MKYCSLQSNDKGGLSHSKDYSVQDGCHLSFLFDNSLLIHQCGFSYEKLLQQELKKIQTQSASDPLTAEANFCQGKL